MHIQNGGKSPPKCSLFSYLTSTLFSKKKCSSYKYYSRSTTTKITNFILDEIKMSISIFVYQGAETVIKIWLLRRNRPRNYDFVYRFHSFPNWVSTKKLNEIYFMYIKHHTKISRWYLLVEILKIDIKYTFLVEFHIFSRSDRLFIYWCDVIARANMENYYQHIRWDKELIKSKNNESYTFHL